MDDKQTYPLPPEEEQMLKQLRAPFAAAKDDLWEELAAQMEETEPFAERRSVKHRSLFAPLRIAIAACIALLLAFGFARWHSTEIYVASGQQQEIQLPDGSKVTLNSRSQLSYHPYWWQIKREVQLRGEGFFEVEKGKTFEVISPKGKTQVLGTRFNIFARKNSYEVFCEHGKVRVASAQSNQADTLLPGMLWKISSDQTIVQNLLHNEPMAWMEGRFYADDLPLVRVFQEMEYHFGIEIQADPDWLRQHTYSGNFNLPDNPDQALELICAPFGVGISHHFSNQYTINP